MKTTKYQRAKLPQKTRTLWNFSPLILLLLIIIYLMFRNNNEISELKQNGKLINGFIYKKKSVGSKGTIRSFYRFKVANIYYEGFDDDENLSENDSVPIIYIPENPELNRTQEFVKNYK